MFSRFGGKLIVVIIITENGIGEPSSNPRQGVYISFHANALEKGMNPSVLPPAMGKY